MQCDPYTAMSELRTRQWSYGILVASCYNCRLLAGLRSWCASSSRSCVWVVCSLSFSSCPQTIRCGVLSSEKRRATATRIGGLRDGICGSLHEFLVGWVGRLRKAGSAGSLDACLIRWVGRRSGKLALFIAPFMRSWSDGWVASAL